MSRLNGNMVRYNPAVRQRAKTEGKALITLDIDGRETRFTIQGPATAEKEEKVRRLMLEFSGMTAAQVDEVIAKENGTWPAPQVLQMPTPQAS